MNEVIMQQQKPGAAVETQIPRTSGAFLTWMFRRIWLSKKWWLLPFWALLLALGIILFLTGNGALLPAVYLAF